MTRTEIALAEVKAAEAENAAYVRGMLGQDISVATTAQTTRVALSTIWTLILLADDYRSRFVRL